MLPDRVSNPGPLTYESGVLPIALRGPAIYIAAFFLRFILKRTSTEAHVYMRRHQGVKVEHFDVSNVIYHKFSHGAVFYTLNGENVNVMLEFLINHVTNSRRAHFAP